MGNTLSIKKINYEDLQYAIKHPDMYLIINTMSHSEQHCLITNTTYANDEENFINSYINTNKSINIIIYGKNYGDDTLIHKYQQLYSLGFYNIFVYPGGMFEWLMLQDIYGNELFPTTNKEIDFLKYKYSSSFTINH